MTTPGYTHDELMALNAAWPIEAAARESQEPPVPPLHVRLATLYDTVEVSARGMRADFFCGRWPDGPHGGLWRGMTNPSGKTDLEISPYIIYGGQLRAPQVFRATRASIIYQCAPSWWGTRDDGCCAELKRVEALDATKMRADIHALKSHGEFVVRCGLGTELGGPLAILPRPTEFVIPPQQMFWFQVGFTVMPALHYVWRLIVRLEGRIWIETA